MIVTANYGTRLIVTITQEISLADEWEIVRPQPNGPSLIEPLEENL